MLKRRIYLLVFVLIFLNLSTTYVKASQVVWTLQKTTDCSGQGGTNKFFDNLCYNSAGTNSTFPWNGSARDAIHVSVEVGHQYLYDATSPFSYGVTSGNSDFLATYASDGQNQITRGGLLKSDWLFYGDGLHDGKISYNFNAQTSDFYLVIPAGCDSSTGCYFENLSLIDLEETQLSTPTPTPTPTEIPVPTATPTAVPIPTPTVTPTPSEVTKVFFAPGMGASWNVDAFIGCKKSGYNGDWSLAPYAKSVYSSTLSTLTSKGWNVLLFNYDWRQNIKDNGMILNNFINSNTTTNEKINMVGHSMGGLVEQAYLVSQMGGKASKFYGVGVPNQGSALSYPVSGGEIWADDLTEKIGVTLFFNHCGIPESYKNVLPTYNYLRDNKTKLLKENYSLKTQNNFLPTNFVSPFWGVKVGTLAGTDQQTLKIINVTKDSKWPDGKPTAKEYVNQGDGTVLLQSAQIDGALNDVISESHSGIIASTEGINHILRFLGTPEIPDPPYSDSKSSLILIGYPGNFWVTDKNGVVTQSENGMVAIMDPTDGNYQLQITPTSANTTFIVGQFLPSGKTLYKEYKLKGLTQEPKVIEYNSKRPNEDILHGVKEFTKPNFPKFWNEFWKCWNKFYK